jgi:hypothetical protein
MKKAQSPNASGAAVLVAAIAALLVAYILFLPPADRAELLGENTPGNNVGPNGQIRVLATPVILLDETVGLVSVARTNSIEHALLATTIETKVAPDEIKRIDSLYVRRGAFEEQSKRITFKIDKQLSHNLQLSFNVESGKGRLIILLNDQEIYNAEATGTLQPIDLSPDLLQEENNLTFRASSPGGAFWSMNEYSLKGILIAGDLSDYSRAATEQHFSLSANEMENFDKAEVKFTPKCTARSTAPLMIFLNEQPLMNSMPNCNAVNTIEVAQTFFSPGDNTIVFQSGAAYQLSAIKVKTYLKKPVDPVYYFDLPPELYDILNHRDAEALVYIDFTEGEKVKEMTITLNGHKAKVKTNAIKYTLRVSSYLKEGTNSLTISPVSDSLTIAS